MAWTGAIRIWLILNVIALMGVASVAETYKIDPVHSFVLFRVKHLGIGYAYGRFNKITGQFFFDRRDPTKSWIQIEIPVESLDTNDPKRDAHLKSPDFFDAKQFPKIIFQSRKVRQIGKDTFEVLGDLTLHGITRPLKVRVTLVGEGKDPWGGYRVGFVTTFTIRRSQFGMTYMLDGISDAVTIFFAVEGVRQ